MLVDGLSPMQSQVPPAVPTIPPHWYDVTVSAHGFALIFRLYGNMFCRLPCHYYSSNNYKTDYTFHLTFSKADVCKFLPLHSWLLFFIENIQTLLQKLSWGIREKGWRSTHPENFSRDQTQCTPHQSSALLHFLQILVNRTPSENLRAISFNIWLTSCSR